jgi:hypothetical protein
VTESSKLPVSSGTGKPDKHRIFDNTLGNTQKFKMYTCTLATGYSVSILVKRPRYRRAIAQLVAIREGGAISRTPRGPSELLRRSGFGRSGTPCCPPSRRCGGGILFLPVQRVGEWTPHRSDCSTARPTALPLLPGSGGILVLSHELINVKNNWTGIPGLGIPHLRVVPIPII